MKTNRISYIFVIFAVVSAITTGCLGQEPNEPAAGSLPSLTELTEVVDKATTGAEGAADWSTPVKLVIIFGGLAIMPSGAGPTQAVASGIRLATRTELLGPAPVIPPVPAEAAHSVAPAGMPGFHVRSIKAIWTKGWGREQMNRLLDFGGTGPICFAPGMPFAGREAGERIVPVVNLHHTGPRGHFSDQTGYPDEPFPGVDGPGDTLIDDDDDHFATEVRTLVYLTAGLHVLGASHDEGVYLTVGGILVGSCGAPDLQAPSDFPFEIAHDGWYPLTVRTFTTTGEASLELHEVVFSSEGGPRRALLGDPVCGVSPVRVP